MKVMKAHLLKTRLGWLSIGITFVLSCCFLISSAKTALSQIQVRTDLVVVPVSVKGPNGDFVTGLAKEDFRVLEDGRQQSILNFDSDPQPMSIAVIIDDGVTNNALQRVAPLLFVISAGFTPDDEAAVFRFDQIVDRLSDFSNDPKQLEKSFKVISKIAEAYPVGQQELITGGPGWLRSTLRIFDYGNKTGSDNRVIHNAVYEAANALKSRPGDRRRIILLISDGQGAGKNNVHSLDQNTDLLLRNNIQVFAVSTEYGRFGSFGALSSYANVTGGDVRDGQSQGAMEHAFNQITEEARRQYVLGYRSRNNEGTPGEFRTIEVKMRQPDLKVTHRKGYAWYSTP
jgi:VWFA-related protein